MRIIETLGAQGEIRIFRVDKIPAGAKAIEKGAGDAFERVTDSNW